MRRLIHFFLASACVSSLIVATAVSAQVPSRQGPGSGSGAVAPGKPVSESSSSAQSSSAADSSGGPSGAPPASSVSSSAASSVSSRQTASSRETVSSASSASSQQSSSASSVSSASSLASVAALPVSSHSSVSSSLQKSEASADSSLSVHSEASSSFSSSLPMLLSQTASGQIVSLLDPQNFRRERFGYGVPVIDPVAIIHPSRISLEPGAIAGNLFLAILIASVMALSGFMFRRLIASDEERVRKILQRLPFQLLLTLLIIWVVRLLVPAASAQGLETMSASLLRIPLYAFLFFLIVGTSNYLFNNMLNAEGDKLRVISGIFSEDHLSGKKWFLPLLILGYGIVGAHINPSFSLLPGRELGILLITAVAIVFSVCVKDVILSFLARFWGMPVRFRANVSGFAIAVVCIALSRAFALSPGYIYGVPLILLIVSQLYKKREGFFEFFGILWILLLAGICWMLGSSFGSYEILTDLFNLLFVMLAEDAFFEMLPLPYLAGGVIYNWKKSLWFLQAVTVIFFLFHTLFNPQGTVLNLTQSPPAASALVLLFCYAVGVFLLWAFVVWGRKPSEALVTH